MLPQDRIAKAMIDDAEAKGIITPGKVRVQCASQEGKKEYGSGVD